ncbi:MAG: hypothetical protein GX596_01345 [Propionibacterium sp.]|nr:hypothetical protein [Propionibacterium sp.]
MVETILSGRWDLAPAQVRGGFDHAAGLTPGGGSTIKTGRPFSLREA